MLFSVGYRIILFFLFLGYLPRFFYLRIKKKKYRGHLLARLGMRRYPFGVKEGPRIWIHAVSLGETKAAVPLVKSLRQDFPHHQFFFSATTETGLHEARTSLKGVVDYIFLLPFDLFVRRIVRQISPDLLILTEGDLWFNLIDEGKKRGATILLINGKISEKPLSWGSLSPVFYKKVSSLIDKLIVQNELYKSRFIALGVDPDKLFVSGNLKWDTPPKILSEREMEEIKARLLLEKAFVITFGSTHPGEEVLFIPLMKRLIEGKGRFKFFLVPRHLERLPEIVLLLKQSELPFSRFSDKNGFEKSAVILVDVMGVLNTCYALSEISCVAGSWTEKIGGHNILEPLWFQKAMIFGPHMHAQPELEQVVLASKAGLQVTKEGLEEAIVNLISQEDERKALGRRGKELIEATRGSLERTRQSIFPWLKRFS